ncbi:hypothetical protein LCGC14_0224820 [marine sediment metagenome]|uniref:Rubredoxin-like domain-containing protein n=1 Tax=marine sediment metagenome TaxID=412755 RepID=A0A0F9XG82_9ZZZZ
MKYEMMCLVCGCVFESEDANESLNCPKCKTYRVEVNMRGV